MSFRSAIRSMINLVIGAAVTPLWIVVIMLDIVVVLGFLSSRSRS